MRVLFADQGSAARMLTRRLLAGAGHETVEVRTVTEALEVAWDGRIDAVLMGAVLVALDGPEWPHCPLPRMPMVKTRTTRPPAF